MSSLFQKLYAQEEIDPVKTNQSALHSSILNYTKVAPVSQYISESITNEIKGNTIKNETSEYAQNIVERYRTENETLRALLSQSRAECNNMKETIKGLRQRQGANYKNDMMEIEKYTSGITKIPASLEKETSEWETQKLKLQTKIDELTVKNKCIAEEFEQYKKTSKIEYHGLIRRLKYMILENKKMVEDKSQTESYIRQCEEAILKLKRQNIALKTKLQKSNIKLADLNSETISGTIKRLKEDENNLIIDKKKNETLSENDWIGQTQLSQKENVRLKNSLIEKANYLTDAELNTLKRNIQSTNPLNFSINKLPNKQKSLGGSKSRPSSAGQICYSGRYNEMEFNKDNGVRDYTPDYTYSSMFTRSISAQKNLERSNNTNKFKIKERKRNSPPDQVLPYITENSIKDPFDITDIDLNKMLKNEALLLVKENTIMKSMSSEKHLGQKQNSILNQSMQCKNNTKNLLNNENNTNQIDDKYSQKIIREKQMDIPLEVDDDYNFSTFDKEDFTDNTLFYSMRKEKEEKANEEYSKIKAEARAVTQTLFDEY